MPSGEAFDILASMGIDVSPLMQQMDVANDYVRTSTAQMQATLDSLRFNPPQITQQQLPDYTPAIASAQGYAAALGTVTDAQSSAAQTGATLSDIEEQLQTANDSLAGVIKNQIAAQQQSAGAADDQLAASRDLLAVLGQLSAALSASSAAAAQDAAAQRDAASARQQAQQSAQQQAAAHRLLTTETNGLVQSLNGLGVGASAVQRYFVQGSQAASQLGSSIGPAKDATLQLSVAQQGMASLVLLGAQAIVQATSSYVAYADQIRNNAAMLGTDQLEVQALTAAFSANGLQAGQSVLSLGMMEEKSANLAEQLKNGQPAAGNYANALHQLGISVEDFVTMPFAQQLDVFSAAMQTHKNDVNAVGLAYDVLGRYGRSIIPVLEQGPQAIAQWKQAVLDANAGVEQNQQAVLDWHAALTKLHLEWTGLEGELASGALPLLTAGVTVLRGVATAAVETGQAIGGFVTWLKNFGDVWNQLPKSIRDFTQALTDSLNPVQMTNNVIDTNAKLHGASSVATKEHSNAIQRFGEEVVNSLNPVKVTQQFLENKKKLDQDSVPAAKAHADAEKQLGESIAQAAALARGAYQNLTAGDSLVVLEGQVSKLSKTQAGNQLVTALWAQEQQNAGRVANDAATLTDLYGSKAEAAGIPISDLTKFVSLLNAAVQGSGVELVGVALAHDQAAEAASRQADAESKLATALASGSQQATTFATTMATLGTTGGQAFLQAFGAAAQGIAGQVTADAQAAVTAYNTALGQFYSAQQNLLNLQAQGVQGEALLEAQTAVTSAQTQLGIAKDLAAQKIALAQDYVKTVESTTSDIARLEQEQVSTQRTIDGLGVGSYADAARAKLSEEQNLNNQIQALDRQLATTQPGVLATMLSAEKGYLDSKLTAVKGEADQEVTVAQEAARLKDQIDQQLNESAKQHRDLLLQMTQQAADDQIRIDHQTSEERIAGLGPVLEAHRTTAIAIIGFLKDIQDAAATTQGFLRQVLIGTAEAMLATAQGQLDILKGQVENADKLAAGIKHDETGDRAAQNAALQGIRDETTAVVDLNQVLADGYNLQRSGLELQKQVKDTSDVVTQAQLDGAHAVTEAARGQAQADFAAATAAQQQWLAVASTIDTTTGLSTKFSQEYVKQAESSAKTAAAAYHLSAQEFKDDLSDESSLNTQFTQQQTAAAQALAAYASQRRSLLDGEVTQTKTLTDTYRTFTGDVAAELVTFGQNWDRAGAQQVEAAYSAAQGATAAYTQQVTVVLGLEQQLTGVMSAEDRKRVQAALDANKLMLDDDQHTMTQATSLFRDEASQWEKTEQDRVSASRKANADILKAQQQARDDGRALSASQAQDLVSFGAAYGATAAGMALSMYNAAQAAENAQRTANAAMIQDALNLAGAQSDADKKRLQAILDNDTAVENRARQTYQNVMDDYKGYVSAVVEGSKQQLSAQGEVFDAEEAIRKLRKDSQTQYTQGLEGLYAEEIGIVGQLSALWGTYYATTSQIARDSIKAQIDNYTVLLDRIKEQIREVGVLDSDARSAMKDTAASATDAASASVSLATGLGTATDATQQLAAAEQTSAAAAKTAADNYATWTQELGASNSAVLDSIEHYQQLVILLDDVRTSAVMAGDAMKSMLDKPSTEELQLQDKISALDDQLAGLNDQLANSDPMEQHIAELQKAYDQAVQNHDTLQQITDAKIALDTALKDATPQERQGAAIQQNIDALTNQEKALKADMDALAAHRKALQDHIAAQEAAAGATASTMQQMEDAYAAFEKNAVSLLSRVGGAWDDVAKHMQDAATAAENAAKAIGSEKTASAGGGAGGVGISLGLIPGAGVPPTTTTGGLVLMPGASGGPAGSLTGPKVGSFAHGGLVPEDMLAYVHRNEVVIPANVPTQPEGSGLPAAYYDLLQAAQAAATRLAPIAAAPAITPTLGPAGGGGVNVGGVTVSVTVNGSNLTPQQLQQQIKRGVTDGITAAFGSRAGALAGKR